MKRIAIESPFNGTPAERARNMRYLAWCIKRCLDSGCSPYASHGLGPCAYPEDPEHRALGLAAGAAFVAVCDESWFFADLGWSPGMVTAQKIAQETGRVWHIIGLRIADWEAFQRGEWPPGATMRWVPEEFAA